MPAVTVFSKPSGLPIAIASSPTRGSSLANSADGRSVRSTWMTARSVSGSVARTCAGMRSPLASWTSTAVAPSTTWLFVTMSPFGPSQTTPEPCAPPEPVWTSTDTIDGWRRWTRFGMRSRSPVGTASGCADASCVPVSLAGEAEVVAEAPQPAANAASGSATATGRRMRLVMTLLLSNGRFRPGCGPLRLSYGALRSANGARFERHPVEDVRLGDLELRELEVPDDLGDREGARPDHA